MSEPINKRLIHNFFETENYLSQFRFILGSEDSPRLDSPNSENLQMFIRQFLIFAASKGFDLKRAEQSKGNE